MSSSWSISSRSSAPRRVFPDAVLYVNGLPLVVFEFKSAIRLEATLHEAYVQLTVRYRRDIPELLKYNALCVISDGVNTKMGSLFGAYEFFYAWRKIGGEETVAEEGIGSLHSMIQGLFDPHRLLRVIRDFVFFPDASRRGGQDRAALPAVLRGDEAVRQHPPPPAARRRRVKGVAPTSVRPAAARATRCCS